MRTALIVGIGVLVMLPLAGSVHALGEGSAGHDADPSPLGGLLGGLLIPGQVTVAPEAGPGPGETAPERAPLLPSEAPTPPSAGPTGEPPAPESSPDLSPSLDSLDQANPTPEDLLGATLQVSTPPTTALRPVLPLLGALDLHLSTNMLPPTPPAPTAPEVPPAPTTPGVPAEGLDEVLGGDGSPEEPGSAPDAPPALEPAPRGLPEMGPAVPWLPAAPARPLADGPPGPGAGGSGGDAGTGTGTVGADLTRRFGLGPALHEEAAETAGPASAGLAGALPEGVRSAAGAVLAVLASGLAALAAYLVGFRHVGKHNLLTHDFRQRLVETIRTHPGMHMRELARRHDLTPTNAAYHLRVLERHGLIRSERVTGKRVYFPAASREDKARYLAQSLLYQAPRARVLQAIGRNPGTNQSRLAELTRQHQGAVSWHIRQLVDAGMVAEERTSRECMYRLTALGDELAAENLASQPATPAAPASPATPAPQAAAGAPLLPEPAQDEAAAEMLRSRAPALALADAAPKPLSR